MRLTSAELDAWARELYSRLGEKLSWTRVSRDAEFKSVTVSMQRTRNQVDAQMLINICHTRKLDPLRELSRIPRWSFLGEATSKPTQVEILASVHPAYALQELTDRLLVRIPKPPGFASWDDYPARFSTWIDVAGTNSTRETLRETLGLTASSMSKRLNGRERFRVDEVIDGFSAAQMDPVYALVLAGAITPQDAGYGENLRKDALLAVSDDDLLALTMKQQRYVRRILKDQHIAGEYLGKLQ